MATTAIEETSSSLESVVPGFFVQAVVAALVAEGADPAALNELAGRNLSASDAALLWLPVTSYRALLQGACQLLNNPGIGLVIGHRLTESSLHVLGPIIVASASLRAAVENMDLLHGTILPGEPWRLSVRSAHAFYGPRALDQHDEARIGIELVMALAFACAARFVGVQNDGVVEAHFAYPAPQHAALYEQIFGGRAHFNASRTALSFPRALLDVPRAGTDPAFANELCKLAISRYSAPSVENSWTARLTNTLRAHAQLAHVDFEKIAATWQISARTLRRRIELEGTRLSDVLNRVRFERAQQLLNLPNASVREIAESLGYSEVSSFQRAFKRWAGVAPGEYRGRAIS